jgi:D-serine deaminase-like pyridoxal phosphate-dependent protein
MAAKARSSGVKFRPHFKTHHSAEIGEWFRPYDVSSIAVSSVGMAKYFADHNWNDIMVCVPANIREINELNDLSKNVTLHVLVDSLETTNFLGEKMQSPVKVWIEIDTGYRRTGVPAARTNYISKIAEHIEKYRNLELTGILTHAGTSYYAKSLSEIRKIYHETTSQLKTVQGSLASAGFPELEVSVGDTPTCSVMKKFEAPISEIRPGNFVFYDLSQLNLGSCREDEISMTVACPVISKAPERNEVIIYGGGASLSKEFYTKRHNVYGLVALPDDEKGRTKSVKNVYIASISQEHGKIIGPKKFVNRIKIGDVLIVLPVHACQTVLLHKEYQTCEGEIINSYQPSIR